MHIVELIEIALANSTSRRVEVAALEPAELGMEVVSGLAQIVSELVDNATAFSEPEDKVTVTGLFDQESYLVSISDRGVGIPDEMISELNRVLDDPHATSGPEPTMGIALVARLAARAGLDVELFPGVPGTTARVTVPPRFVTRAGEESFDRSEGGRLPSRRPFAPRETEPHETHVQSGRVETWPDSGGSPMGLRHASGVVAMSEQARREAEEFLDRVFGPLINGPEMTRPPRSETTANANFQSFEPTSGLEPGPARGEGGTVTALRTRVPGENFALIEDDPSTIAAERAIDIRSALSRFDEGRRAAKDKGGD
jgi:anti-sigma regulatory factor (Ser/Thr protein kinase)